MFQSPSRWGRCCILTTSSGVRSTAAFQSPSRWGRCCIAPRWPWRSASRVFQSPSRWGRCCIRGGHGARLGHPGVSVPFSMGTVLHLDSTALRWPWFACVSVPFSMGTVLHRSRSQRMSSAVSAFQSPSRWGRCCIRQPDRRRTPGRIGFSPLLDGDGVASAMSRIFSRAVNSCFSPLLDGDGVASSTGSDRAIIGCAVSVPFSMGTVLHRRPVIDAQSNPAGFSPLLDGDGVASSTAIASRAIVSCCFSPLLDGDGVASIGVAAHDPRLRLVSVPFSMGTVLHRHATSLPSFSPLLDGDGVASRRLAHPVSVPFSMGTVLHRAEVSLR